MITSVVKRPLRSPPAMPMTRQPRSRASAGGPEASRRCPMKAVQQPVEWLWRSLTYGRRQPMLREERRAQQSLLTNERQ
jgi:hypothetical protein